MGSIKLFWHQSKPKGNFGDELSPWIIEKLSGRKVVYIPIFNLTNDIIISLKSIIKKLYFKEYKIAEFSSFKEDKKAVGRLNSLLSAPDTDYDAVVLLDDYRDCIPDKYYAVMDDAIAAGAGARNA